MKKFTVNPDVVIELRCENKIGGDAGRLEIVEDIEWARCGSGRAIAVCQCEGESQEMVKIPVSLEEAEFILSVKEGKTIACFTTWDVNGPESYLLGEEKELNKAACEDLAGRCHECGGERCPMRFVDGVTGTYNKCPFAEEEDFYDVTWEDWKNVSTTALAKRVLAREYARNRKG